MHAKYLNYAEQNDFNYSDNYKEVSENIQGESQRVFHLLAELNTEEALVLAMRYNWDLLQSNPKDTEIQGVVDDLFSEFASVFESLSGFSSTAAPVTNKAEESESKTKSKNDKIKSASGKKDYWQGTRCSKPKI